MGKMMWVDRLGDKINGRLVGRKVPFRGTSQAESALDNDLSIRLHEFSELLFGQ